MPYIADQVDRFTHVIDDTADEGWDVHVGWRERWLFGIRPPSLPCPNPPTINPEESAA